MAPIVLFAYKRPSQLRRTIEALQKNPLSEVSDLFVYSDGSKNESDRPGVEEVREFLHTVTGFKSVEIIESPVNKGLAHSIVAGVTRTVNQFGQVIVLEDDIVTAPGFLKYMNTALDYYESKENVMEITGFMFPIDPSGLPDTFFYQANTCWGWATWSRAWKFYNDDADFLLQELKSKEISWKQFNSMQGREFQKQLLKNINGTLTTWAVKWHATMKLHGGTVLHPRSSYVSNVGLDGSGENSLKQDEEGPLDDQLDLDITAAENHPAEMALIRLSLHFRKRFSIISKIARRIKNFS
jgi:Glycosyl transferase family 2